MPMPTDPDLEAQANALPLGESWPADRILTDRERRAVNETLDEVLREMSIGAGKSYPPQGVSPAPDHLESLTIEASSGQILTVKGYVDHDDHPQPLFVDEHMDCEHHPDTDGGQMDHLGVLGDDYAALERDLIEEVARTVDLPEITEELASYVHPKVAFMARTCSDGTLGFTLSVSVPEHTLALHGVDG